MLLSVPFPQAIRSLWALMRLLALDVFSVRAAECALRWNAFDVLVAASMVLPALLLLVGAMRAAALGYVRARKKNLHAWREEVHVLASGAALGLSFLLYPALAAACFAFFPCDAFVHADGVERRFSRVDLSISCDDGAHGGRIAVAGVATIAYVLGIPLAWARLLWPHRHTLADADRRADVDAVRPLAFLWEAYRPGCWWCVDATPAVVLGTRDEGGAPERALRGQVRAFVLLLAGDHFVCVCIRGSRLVCADLRGGGS